MKEKVKFDIVVVGGGLAGVCAAVAAARECKKSGGGHTVALVHDRPMLGGCSSSEVRIPPIGASRHAWGNETGIIHEMIIEERTRNHIHWDNGTINSIWDLILWETVVAEEAITLYLNTTVRGVRMHDGGQRIAAVAAYQLGNEREYEIEGGLFVDATGDGTVGFEAGADFRIGQEAGAEFGEKFAPLQADDACMGTSLQFQARDIGREAPFVPPPYAACYPNEECLHSRPHTDFRNGYWWIEVGIPWHTIDDNEAIRDELIRHVLGVWDHLKNHCPQFKDQARNWVLDWFGWVPGKRESRRLMGDYILTEKDLRASVLFDDQVAYGGHFLDLHTMGGILAKDQPGNPVNIDPKLYDDMRVNPYSIPLRSLYSVNVDNLMMAGRDLSASHVAMGSTRVMLTNAVMGQGVGTVAALCIRERRTPRDCGQNRIETVQQSLLRQGCYLPFLHNTDETDLARRAAVQASSEAALSVEPETDGTVPIPNPHQRQPMDTPLGALFPVTNGIGHISLWLESEQDHPVTIEAGLRQADHVWDYTERSDSAVALAVLEAGYKGWVRFDFQGMDHVQGLYWIHIDTVDEETGRALFWRYRLDIPTGCVSVWKRRSSNYWYYLNEGYRKGFRMLCLRVEPESRPYGAANILSGVTRPEQGSNIWVSDPRLRMPQYVQLRWTEDVRFNTVEITFDTDLCMCNESTPPFTRQSKCVCDYDIAVFDGGQWRVVCSVEGNYQRMRRHVIKTQTASAMRIIVRATNGDPSARIYEVRVYEEEIS